MAALSHGKLHRSIGRMAVRVSQEAKAKATEGDRYALKESEQQFQIDFSGTATAIPLWATVSIIFDETIYMAPYQRDSVNEEPHVTIGKVWDAGPPLFIDVHIVSWKRDPNGDFIGATVRVGAYDPANSRQRFRGRVHVTFQAMSAPVDPDEPSGDATNNTPIIG